MEMKGGGKVWPTSPRRVLDTTCTPTGKRSREPPSWPLSPFSPPRLMGYRPFPRRSDSLQERAPFTPLISPLIQAAATYEAPPSPPSPASFRKRRHPARSILKAGWGEGGGGSVIHVHCVAALATYANTPRPRSHASGHQSRIGVKSGPGRGPFSERYVPRYPH